MAEGEEVARPRISVRYVPAADLEPDPGNPRRIGDDEFAALVHAIDQFGLTVPLIVRGKRIVGGHQRHRAALELGIEEVPVVERDDLTEQEADALNVVLNNPRAQGEYDPQLLLDRVLGLQEYHPDLLPATGFTDEDLDDLLMGGEMDLSTGFLDDFDAAGQEAAEEVAQEDERQSRKRESSYALGFSLDRETYKQVTVAIGLAKDRDAAADANTALGVIARFYVESKQE